MIGRNKTATAVNAAQVQAEGRRGPMLQLRAEMERRQAYQILQLRKDNWPEEMYASLDKKVGGDAGRWFRQSDIYRDFVIEIVPESWWPQTAEQRKADLAALYAVADPTNPQIIKALWSRATELHGRGLDLNAYQSDRIEARIRLERLREVAEFVEKGSGVPVYDQQGVPVGSMINLAIEKARLVPELTITSENGDPICTNPILDRHDEYIEAYSSWLLTSEGRDASPFVRAVVNRVIVRHYDGKVQFTQFMQQEEMKANAPQMAAQEQMMAAQHEQERAEMAEAEQSSKQDMIIQALGEQAIKETDREHEAGVKMKLAEHQAKLAPKDKPKKST
jgi:hypothetical protein